MDKTSIFSVSKKILFYVFFLAVIYFFGSTLFQNYSSLENVQIQFNIFPLLLSFVTYISFFLSLTILWQYILGEKQIPFKKILYINSISWVSKYIPGKIAMILTKVLYLKENFKIDRKQSFISCIYEHIFQILSSFILSFPFIIYYFSGTQESSYIIISFIAFIILLIGIHPSIFNTGLNIALKLVKKEKVDQKNFLTLGQIGSNLFGYSLSMIIKGISFTFLVAGVTSFSFSQVPFFMFAWIFAGVIGIISIFAPNGLGVREGVLVFLLQFMIPLELAIIISIISRLWFSICDLMIGFYVGYEKYKYLIFKN